MRWANSYTTVWALPIACAAAAAGGGSGTFVMGIKQARIDAEQSVTFTNMTGPAANVAKMQAHFLKQVQFGP